MKYSINFTSIEEFKKAIKIISKLKEHEILDFDIGGLYILFSSNWTADFFEEMWGMHE